MNIFPEIDRKSVFLNWKYVTENVGVYAHVEPDEDDIDGGDIFIADDFRFITLKDKITLFVNVNETLPAVDRVWKDKKFVKMKEKFSIKFETIS